jgi:hypothetical protein
VQKDAVREDLWKEMNYIYKAIVSLVVLPLIGAVMGTVLLKRAGDEMMEQGIYADGSSGRRADRERADVQAGSRISSLFMAMISNVIYGAVELFYILTRKFHGLPDFRMMKGIRISSDRYMLVMFGIGMLGLIVNILVGWLSARDIRAGALNQDADGNHRYAMCLLKVAGLDALCIVALCCVIVNLASFLA